MNLRIGDRIVCAVMASFLGAVIGALLCVLYRYGLSVRIFTTYHDDSLVTWARNSAYFFAVFGFIFEYKIADAIGNVLSSIHYFERGEDDKMHIPAWLGYSALVFGGYLFWYYVVRQAQS